MPLRPLASETMSRWAHAFVVSLGLATVACAQPTPIDNRAWVLSIFPFAGGAELQLCPKPLDVTKDGRPLPAEWTVRLLRDGDIVETKTVATGPRLSGSRVRWEGLASGSTYVAELWARRDDSSESLQGRSTFSPESGPTLVRAFDRLRWPDVSPTNSALLGIRMATASAAREMMVTDLGTMAERSLGTLGNGTPIGSLDGSVIVVWDSDGSGGSSIIEVDPMSGSRVTVASLRQPPADAFRYERGARIDFFERSSDDSMATWRRIDLRSGAEEQHAILADAQLGATFLEPRPRVSPSGNRVAYVTNRAEVVVLDLATGTEVARLRYSDRVSFDSSPEWSADSTRIALAVRRSCDSAAASIWVLDLVTESWRQATGFLGNVRLAHAGMDWIHIGDADQLVFSDDWATYLVAAPGRRTKPLRGPGRARWPRVVPVGRGSCPLVAGRACWPRVVPVGRKSCPLAAGRA
jgi:hypothetical protein